MTNIPPSTSWADEQKQWKSYYLSSFSPQIERVIALVERKKKMPDTLIGHFDSMLALFERGVSHPDPATRLKLVRFVRILHPLPVWWGKWSEWMRVMDKAAIIAQEADEIRSEAQLYLMQSEMLISAGDAKKSLSLSKRALEITNISQDTEMLFQAEMAVYEAQKYLGFIKNLVDAINALEESLSAKRKMLPEKIAQQLEIELLLKKTEVVRRQGHISESADVIQHAYGLAQEIFEPDDLFMSKIYGHRSSIYWSARKYDLAVDNIKRAIEIYKKWGDQTSQIDSEGEIGLVYWSAGRYREAQKTLEASVKMTEKLKSLRWQVIQTGNLGLVHFSRGALSQALALMQQHHTLSKMTNNHAEARRALGNMGTVQIHLGDFEEALKNLHQDHEHTKQLQLNIATARLYAKISWALDGLDRTDEAIEHAEKSLFSAEKMNEPLTKTMALRCLSELAIPVEDKIRYAEEARALAKKYSRRLNEAGALITLADCYQDDSLCHEAEEILEEIGAANWLKVPLVFRTLRLPLLL